MGGRVQRGRRGRGSDRLGGADGDSERREDAGHRRALRGSADGRHQRCALFVAPAHHPQGAIAAAPAAPLLKSSPVSTAAEVPRSTPASNEGNAVTSPGSAPRSEASRASAERSVKAHAGHAAKATHAVAGRRPRRRARSRSIAAGQRQERPQPERRPVGPSDGSKVARAARGAAHARGARGRGAGAPRAGPRLRCRPGRYDPASPLPRLRPGPLTGQSRAVPASHLLAVIRAKRRTHATRESTSTVGSFGLGLRMTAA